MKFKDFEAITANEGVDVFEIAIDGYVKWTFFTNSEYDMKLMKSCENFTVKSVKPIRYPSGKMGFLVEVKI